MTPSNELRLGPCGGAKASRSRCCGLWRPPPAAGFLSSRPSRRRRSPAVKTPEHGRAARLGGSGGAAIPHQNPPLSAPATALGGCPDRHGEDDADAAAGLRAGVAGAAQLRGRGPLRPRQVPRPRRRPPRLHHTEGAPLLASSSLFLKELSSSLFSFKFLLGRLFSAIYLRTCLKTAM